MNRDWFDYLFVVALLLAAAFWGAVIFVAVHFLAKVW